MRLWVHVEGGCCPCRAWTLFGREIIGHIRRIIPIIRPVRVGGKAGLCSRVGHLGENWSSIDERRRSAI